MARRNTIWCVIVVVILLAAVLSLCWIWPQFRPIPQVLLQYDPSEARSSPTTQSVSDASYSAWLERLEQEEEAEHLVVDFRGRDASFADALQPTINLLAKVEIAYKSGVYPNTLRRFAKSADDELTLARRRVPQAQLSIAALQGVIWRYQEAANVLEDENAKAAQTGKASDHFTTGFVMDKAAHYLDRVMIFLGRN